MTLKRFHLFVGRDYYPGCGLDDYKDSFATLAQASALGAALRAENDNNNNYEHDWAVVLESDETTGKLKEVWSA